MSKKGKFMENLSNFAERLSDLMHEKNLRSEGLAKAASVSGSAVRSWLRGDSVPTLENAVRIADFFACSLDYLAGRTDYYEEVVPRERPPFYPNLRKVMEEQGISRYRIARSTAVKDAFFSNWAKGEEPLLVTLCVLADCLGVSLDYLVGRRDF